MEQFDEHLRQIAAEDKFEISQQAKRRLEDTLSVLPARGLQIRRSRMLPRLASMAACLLFVVMFVFPNISVAYAESMEKIPVIGDLIRVVTIRNYFYSDPYHEMDIDVPNVCDPDGGNGAHIINDEVDALTSELVAQFYNELECVGDQGFGSVQVKYNVLRNTDRWFTLKLSVNTISASSNNYFKYYNVDRRTGEVVHLADLFTNPDFNEIIGQNIIAQMRQQMKEDKDKSYWIDKEDFGVDFSSVSDDHNFYFNDNGDLVIPFDKYEVAPGYMGSPEFTIPMKDLQSILKDEYKDMKL